MAWDFVQNQVFHLAYRLQKNALPDHVHGRLDDWHAAGDPGVFHIAAPYQGLGTVERLPAGGYHLWLTSGGHSQHADYPIIEAVKAVLTQYEEKTAQRVKDWRDRHSTSTWNRDLLTGFWEAPL